MGRKKEEGRKLRREERLPEGRLRREVDMQQSCRAAEEATLEDV